MSATERRDPRPGEIWEDRRGKRRLVLSVRPRWAYGHEDDAVEWQTADHKRTPRTGCMELAGWHRRGWRLVAPAGGECCTCPGNCIDAYCPTHGASEEPHRG